jgi:phospholipase/carboxylesterase
MLIYRERPAADEPRGLLILHHGRGSDEEDLFGLADLFDPKRRLHVVTPRAPLPWPDGQGYYWYEVPAVGRPDPASFRDSYTQLSELHDDLWARTGVPAEHTILGGFSMGTAMSFALGLGGDRPAPAGILAFSGFVPVVDGWEPSLADRQDLKVFIAHGTRDPVIPVEFARRSRDLLEAGGLKPEYHESEGAHHLDPRLLPSAVEWIATVIDDA